MGNGTSARIQPLIAIIIALAARSSALAVITPDNPGGGSVQFTVDSTLNVKPISPYIYGMNFFAGSSLDNPVTLDRLGGNRWTGYNWETNASNAGRDWYYQNDNFMGNGPAGNAVKGSLTAAGNNNRALIVTVPMSGYVAGDTAGPVTRAQAYDKSRFKEIVPLKGAPLSLTPNTSDPYVYTDEFVNWVEQNRTGSKPVFYNLDNEPGLWGEPLPVGWQPGVPPPCPPCNPNADVDPSPEGKTHGVLHPYLPTFAELRDKTIATAGAIKSVNPSAMVLGGVGYGWQDFRILQEAPDATSSPSHPQASGGDEVGEFDFYEYLLKNVRDAEVSQGRTLMDAIDLHWYPEAQGDNVRITDNNNGAAVVAARVQAPRSLWDTTYTESSWITNCCSGGPIKLLPRVKKDINDFKPGTKIAITEYNYGGTNHISGAIAQADVLGIFGDQDVFAATFWNLHGDANSQFVEGAFKMYLNYNGSGGKYGDTSVASATTNIAQTSIHASVDSANPNRMVVVAINRTGSAVTTGIKLTHDRVFDHAEIYQLSSTPSPLEGNPYTIARLSDVELNLLNAFQYTLPANSVSTIVLISDGLPGDFNHDGTVDAGDYVVWRNLDGSTGNLAADVNEDNTVDVDDYNLWRANFGRTNSAGSASSVPEPTTLCLALVGLATLARCRRTRE